MTLELGELNAKIGIDNKPYDRGIDKAAVKMAGLQKNTTTRLHQMEKTFAESGEAMGEALAEGMQKKAAEGVEGIYRDTAGKLHLANGKFVKEGTLLTEAMLQGAKKTTPKFRKEGERIGAGLGDGIKEGATPSFRQFIDMIDNRLEGTKARLGDLRKAALYAFLAGGIATGAAGAASAIGPLIVLVGVLGIALVGLAAAVPAFAVGAIAVIGTLTIAFNGLGAAIAGDEEALKALTGPAREFVGVIERLAPAWEDVTRSVQAELFANLGVILERVAKIVLPVLKTGLTSVAGGLNDVAAAALQAATLPEVLNGLSAILDGTGAGLTAMASGVDGWMRGLGILLLVFAPLLERAGVAAADLGERFGAWIAHAQATGQLKDIIKTMLDTLNLLGGIVGNLGSIFSSVFASASQESGGLLAGIESLTGRLATFLASAEGQDQLGTFFGALKTVADAVIPIIVALAGVFATQLAPKIAEIATNLGPSLTAVAGNIGEALSRIDVAKVASAFGKFLEAVSLLLIPLAEILGFLLNLAPVLIPVASAIAIIVGAIKAWQLILVVVTVAQWAWNAALYANPIVWIIAMIVALIVIIVLLVMHWDEVTAALGVAWDWLVAQFSNGKDMLVAAINWIVDTFVGMKDQAVAVFTNFVSNVNTKIDNILSAVQRAGGIPGKIAGFIQSAKDQAIAKFQSLVDWVKGLPDRISDALGNLKDLLFDAGKDILNGLIEGVESMWSSVQSKFSELTGMIPSWKGPENVDRDLLKGPAKWIIGGFAEHLESMFPLVHRALNGLTSDIGLQVDGAAAPATPTMHVEATASLSEEDRELLRELAEARNSFHVSTDANTRVQEIKRDAMVV